MSTTALAPLPARQVYEAAMKSNLQPAEKNAIQQWAEKMLGPLEVLRDVRIQDAPGGLMSVFRQTSEGLGLAAIAAYLHVNVKGGLDVRGAPVDGFAGGLLALMSAFMGHSELGTDFRNVGQDLTLICAFRRMQDFFAQQRLRSGRELYPHLMVGAVQTGRPDSDPVAAAAANL